MEVNGDHQQQILIFGTIPLRFGVCSKIIVLLDMNVDESSFD